MLNPFLSNSFFFLYHLVFILIFLATAIVSLGSLLNLPLFSTIQEQHKKVLLYIILVQVVGAVLITYQSIPLFAYQTQEYEIAIQYQNYEREWLASATQAEFECITDYNSNSQKEPNQSCREIVQSYLRQKEVFGKKGNGKLYYTCDTARDRCHGIVVYYFPLENRLMTLPTVININGIPLKRKAKEKLTLSFEQFPSAAKINDNLVERPGGDYEVTFQYDKDQSQFTGTLETKRNGNPLVIAKINIT